MATRNAPQYVLNQCISYWLAQTELAIKPWPINIYKSIQL
jgi:hypothetical protein